MILKIEQGSPEWFAARLGRATASRFADCLASVKVGEAAARRDYRYALAVERLTGAADPTYCNDAMQWGTTNEPLARAAVELADDIEVQEVGFVPHPTLLAGCSPDGLIEADAGIEIKCPYRSAIHIQTIERGTMPAEHAAQVQGSMWITGRSRWLFVSFDPRMPEGLRLFRRWVERDEKYIATLAEGVERFLADVDATLAKLREVAA